MTFLLPLPFVVPLAAAGLSMMLYGFRNLQRLVGVAAVGGALAASIVLLVRVESDGPQAMVVGAWPLGIGISLVVDMFAALMLTVSMAMVLAVLLYAIGHPGTSDEARFFHPVYLTMTAGVSLSFCTGDLFNLFVAFEVMLTSSYVLLTLGGTRNQVRSSMTYVVISLVASSLFVSAVGLVYAATGTVDLALLSERIPDLQPGVRAGLGLVFLVVFGIKAAIFPLFFWLPDSYPTAPAPVTAIFAGLLTKVGVYAIIRTQTLLFDPGGTSSVLLVVAGTTMVVGVLGALAQDDIKRILSFHIISQIGYMIMGLALFSVAGIAGGIFYIIHHIIVKTALFLVGGIIEHIDGSASLARSGGLLHRVPVVAALFMVPAFSLAGLPPFSGFIAKLSLVQAGTAIDQYVIVAASLGVSLLTLMSMTKIWSAVFWGDDPESAPGRPLPVAMTWATAMVVVMSLGVSVWAQPLHDLTVQAAESVLDPAVYAGAAGR